MNAQLSDAELICEFEDGTLSELPHAMHVRVASLYLFYYGRDDALHRITEGLKRYVARKGVPEKFHATMTRAWIELLESARHLRPEAGTPEALVRSFPGLLEKDALSAFYSPNELWTDAARTGWRGPDLAPRIDAATLVSREAPHISGG